MKAYDQICVGSREISLRYAAQKLVIFCQVVIVAYAISALTQLGVRKSIWPVKIECWCGCLSGARCRLFACGPADANATLKPHRLLPDLNPDWFYLSGTGLPRLSWKRGR